MSMGKKATDVRAKGLVTTMRRRAWTAPVLLLFLPACADIWGFQDLATESESGTSLDGSNVVVDATNGTDGPSDEGGLGDAAPMSDVQAPADVVVTVPDDAPSFDAGVCGVTMVDLVHGVFVAPPPGGVDSAGCGTSPNSPCASIGQGLMTSTMTTGAGARNIVYIAGGPTGGPVALPYVEKLTLPAGVTVQGGWHWAGGGSSEWLFDCSASPESVVTVQALPTQNMTVIANSNNGMSTLSTLTVLSKATANPGESLYGIFATGANTQLTLTDVLIVVQQGGAGQTGANGNPGVTPPTCSPGDGNAATGTATVGTAGAAASVSSTGFSPQTGGTGATGAAGDNGPAGAAGMTVTYSQCTSVTPSCVQGNNFSCVGGTGINGCGGGGGMGGGGGGGGGSSVALFAYDATVIVTAGGFQAGNGGSGGPGGAGGSGVAGSAGSVGSPLACSTSSCMTSSKCISGETTANGGAAPTSGGGQGNSGGSGGGGSGGDSYAILTGGMAFSRLNISLSTPPTLAAGQPGAGGGNGPTGTATATAHF